MTVKLWSDGSEKERYCNRSCAFMHDCIVNQSTDGSFIVGFRSVMTIISVPLHGDFANIITMLRYDYVSVYINALLCINFPLLSLCYYS